MLNYKAPLRDMRFVMNEVFDYPAHYAALSNGKDADPDTVSAILEECAKFCEETLAPLYFKEGDTPCTLKDGVVTTPPGFKDAYDQFVQGGWQGLSHPAEYGGQGLPMSMGLFKSEMTGTANWPFTMYPGLSLGCMNTIMQYAPEALKNVYMPPLTEGRWAGTMCLTEAGAGSAVGDNRTKAERTDVDGLYLLTGEYDFSCTAEDTLRTAAQIPGAEVQVMKELGHFPMSENPARFREYILPVLTKIASTSSS